MAKPTSPKPLRRILLITIAALALAAWVGPPMAAAALKIYVRDSPQAVDLIAHAKDRLDRDEPEEAVKLIQQVIDEHGSKLLEREPGLYSEARRVAAFTLADHPRLLEAYQQLYNPPAQQMLRDAGNSRVKLTGVIDRYAMTSAGFDAGMRLAGLELESGRGEAAGVVLVRLSDHPALGRDRAMWLELSASAALLRGDQVSRKRFAEEIAGLDGAEAEAALGRLEAMSSVLARPKPPTALSPLGELPPASPPDAVARPLWTLPISGAERWMAQLRRTGGRAQIDQAANDGQLLNTTMVAFGSRLFINSGATVHAVEPASGRELWSREVDPSTADGGIAQVYGGMALRDLDLSGIAADERHVVAVAGYNAMLAASFAYYNAVGASSLVCLDPVTGEVRWTRDPLQIDRDLEMSVWYGRPVLWQGRAYCLIRRRARFTFQDTYLVCLDAGSGDVVWRRHLGSAAMPEQGAQAAGLSQMTFDGGWIYVDSGLGTLAKIAAADGLIQWLVTRATDERIVARPSKAPWAISGPVVTRAGVVVLDDRDNTIRVHDAADGKLTRTIESKAWDGPLYLCGLGGDVLAVGPTCARFSGEDLTNLWRHKIGGSLRGRAAVTESLLFLPADNRVVLVDPRPRLPDGAARDRGAREVETPATLLALDGQLIAAQRHRVSAFTSWEVAMARLREQIEQNPADHHPLVALAWLAYGHDRPDALIDALDRAIALRAAPDAEPLSAELFEQMRRMAADQEKPDFGVREKLFERMAAIAESPDQEVVYRLTYGEHLESAGRVNEAIEQYQALLSEPVYRQRLFRHPSGSRQAGLESQQRLRAIVDKHGREVYAPFDEFAARRLAELTQQNDPAPLEELATAYPMSASAGEALVLAADRAAAQDRTAHAVSLLHRAAQLTPDAERRAAIVGREAELLQARGEPNRAAHALRKLLLAHPDARPLRGGSPVDPRPWLAELDAAARHRSELVRVKLPLSGGGRVVQAALAADPIDAGDGDAWLLLRAAAALECRRASDLALLWSFPLDDQPVSVIAADSRRSCLYFPASQRLVMLDTAGGKPVWEDARVQARLDSIPVAPLPRDPEDPRIGVEPRPRPVAPGRVVIRGNARFVDGRLVQIGDVEPPQQPEPEPKRPLLASDDDAVALADDKGRIVVLSGDRGAVRWQVASPLRRADQLHLFGEHLVITGYEDDGSPLLCVYETANGALLHRIRKSRLEPFNWVGMTANSRLILIGDSQIEMFDLTRGQTTWLCEPGSRLMPQASTALGFETLVTATREGAAQLREIEVLGGEQSDLLFINLDNGQIVNRAPIRGFIAAPINVRPDLGQWISFGSDNVVAYDAEGNERWRSAVTGGVRFTDALPTESHVIALASPLREGAGGLAELCIFDRATGRLVERSAFRSASGLSGLSALEGRLLLLGDDLTAILDGAKP